jgi:hypothetical protein
VGLITGLLGLPLAPVRGVVAAAEQIRQQAEEEFYDPVRIRKELEHVEQLRSNGEIDDEEATAWEDQLVERLMTAREIRRGNPHG